MTEFTGAVDADRSAMDTLLGRVEGLSAPGEMGSAQKSLEIVYELRDAAMDTIATKMKTALGEAGAQQATAAIARQMQKLLASDVIYESVTRPEINGKLADNGIEDHEVPKSTFVPDGTKWLDEAEVAKALAQVSGSERRRADRGHPRPRPGRRADRRKRTGAGNAELGGRRRHAGNRSGSRKPGRIDGERDHRGGDRERQRNDAGNPARSKSASRKPPWCR